MDITPYKEIIAGYLSRLADAPPLHNPSFTPQELAQSASRALSSFEADATSLKKSLPVLFGSPGNGAALARLLDDWRISPPPVTVLTAVLAAHFSLDPAAPMTRALLLAGLAADVPHDNAFHNGNHFREVVAFAARRIALNNQLAGQKTPGCLSLQNDDIVRLLTTAALHDLKHDGKGNSLNGSVPHIPYRLERIALAAADPLFDLAGVAQPERDAVTVMTLVTDIGAAPGGVSPHHLLRDAYRHQFFGAPAPQLPQELAPLQNSKLLTLSAALLSDCDLGPSTATTYAFSRARTVELAEEMPNKTASIDGRLDYFLHHIVKGRLTSAAAQADSQAQLEDIIRQHAQTPGKQKSPVIKRLSGL